MSSIASPSASPSSPSSPPSHDDASPPSSPYLSTSPSPGTPATTTTTTATTTSTLSPTTLRSRHAYPNRRVAFQHYAEHASETFRSELYTREQPRQLLVLAIGLALLVYIALSHEAAMDAAALNATDATISPSSPSPSPSPSSSSSSLSSASLNATSLPSPLSPSSSATDFITPTSRARAQAAFVGFVILFLTYGAVQFRDSLMVRPHPLFWRLVHALAVVYLLLLAALLVQTLDGARAMVRLLSPQPIEAFKPLDQFATPNVLQCEISWANIWRQLTSPWMLSHFLGWFGKMCLFRDFKYMMICSLLFEFAELSLQFVIPEFKECWWDSVFMDFLGANTLGIICGNIFINFLNRRTYEWMDEDVNEEKKGRRRLPRLASYVDLLMPFSWSEYRWQFFSTFQRFACFVLTTVGQLVLDLNSFFLLHSLQIPVHNKINHARLLLIALLAFPSVSEWYEYVDGKLHRLGPNLWVLLTMTLLELLLILKMGLSIEQFHRLPPVDVWLPWALCLLFCSLFVLFYYQSRIRAWLSSPLQISLLGQPLFHITRARVLALLHACAVLPLLALTWHWKY